MPPSIHEFERLFVEVSQNAFSKTLFSTVNLVALSARGVEDLWADRRGDALASQAASLNSTESVFCVSVSVEELVKRLLRRRAPEERRVEAFLPTGD